MAQALVTGGTGFVGKQLCADLLADGWQVEVVTRDTERARSVLPPDARPVPSLADAKAPDAVINLAGENLAAGRWTRARKREIRESRLRITEDLVAYIRDCETPPSVLVSGSAVGYYGACGDSVVTEDTPPSSEFQSQLCEDWELAAREAEQYGVRVCRIRTGLVLGAQEGALAQMATPFRYGLGGPIGSAAQYMPWIHIRDEVRAIRFLMATESADGAFNLTAPNPVTNKTFTHALGRVLNRPTIAWMPGPVLKVIMGEMAHLLLSGQRAEPRALQNAGFEFAFTELDAALRDLFARG
ncbi:TIGR01777 family protein [Salinisphaera sp. USBA-960]|nr:TIGR01777 family protein [Salifodinibacter halophilus]NNC26300.1 TIGR01777 family protein [Salifodinibacter halophilus]